MHFKRWYLDYYADMLFLYHMVLMTIILFIAIIYGQYIVTTTKHLTWQA